jgi:hypothetical protein
MDPLSRRPSELFLQALKAAKPGDPVVRSRDCGNCRKLQDEIVKHVPHWQPPPVESWLVPDGTGNMRRYYSDLCRQCRIKEQESRVSVAVAAGESRDVAVRRYMREPRERLPVDLSPHWSDKP